MGGSTNHEHTLGVTRDRRARRKRLRKNGVRVLVVTVVATMLLGAPAAAFADDTTTTTPPATTTTPPTDPTTPSTTAPSTTTTTPPATAPAPTTTSTPAPVPPTGPTATLLVKTASGLSATDQAATISSHGGYETSAISALRLHVVSVPAADAFGALSAYQSDPNVASVSVDDTRTVETAATDPGYSNQWALPKIGWDQVHGVNDPSGSATLAVLDTGVDSSTPDLSGRVVGGWSAFGTDPAADANGHGTHVATIAAGKADDGNGIAGVAYQGVNVMPVQVLSADGTGTDSDIINGLVYAADHGADVALLAFSNPGESPALQDAVNYAWSKGVVVVAAAGNDSSSIPTYPAGLAKVVGVGSTDQNDAAASFSNTSAAVFVTAPGTDIATSDASGVSSISGTSASAAIVAGSAALLKAEDTSASPATIVGRIARNTDPNTGIGGNGRINLEHAVADTSTTGVTPAGAPGGGGPVVGPYVAQTRTLTINFSGSGAGSVVDSVTGQTCLSSTNPCNISESNNFASGTLTATASGGSAFAGWSAGSSGANCSGTGTCGYNMSFANQNVTATFNVSGPTKLAVTSVNGGSNPTAGSGFSVTVQSQNAGGTATNVVANTAFTLSVATGTGAIGGTVTGTIAAGTNQVVVSGVTYTKAESGVSLTATRTSGDSLTAGTSASFTVNPGAASKLAVTSVNSGSNPTAGTAFSVVVQSQDSLGNPANVTSASNITLSRATGTGTLGGTLTGTIANGQSQVTVSGVTYTKAESGVSITATQTSGTPSLTAGTSATFTVNPGSGTKLAFGVQPSNASGGTAISPAVTVQVLDSNNNLTTSSASVTVAIGNNAGGGSLSGTATVNASNGTATFNNLSINKLGTGYTLTTSSSGLTGATSTGFNISVGAAAKLSFTTSPSASTTAGSAFAVQPVVTVQDAGGNTVTTDTSTVTLAIGTNPASGTLTCTGGLSTAAVAGVATFSGCSINKSSASTYTLTAADGALTSATSATFTIVPGAAAQVAFSAAPSGNNTAGTAFGTQPIVTVQDVLGNTVTSDSSTVTLAIGTNPAGGTLSCTGGLTKQASSGVATFTGCSIDNFGTGYTLTASDGVLASATTAAFNITVGSALAGDGTMTVAPSAVTAGSTGNSLGFTFTAPATRDFPASSRVTLVVPAGWTAPQTTTSGNPGFLSVANSIGTSCSPSINGISGSGPWTITVNETCAHTDAFTLTYAGGGSAVTAQTTAGTATFTTQSRSGAGSFSSIGTQPAVTVNPGAATKLVFTQQPSSTVTASSAFGTQPKVSVEDANNNVITSDNATQVTLAFATNPVGGTLTCTSTTVTVVAGVATFAGCSIDKATSGTPYTLAASSVPALTTATSSGITVNAGAAAKLVITSPNHLSNPAMGSTFAVTVKSEDAGGNVVNAPSNQPFTLSTNGFGNLSGTTNGTLPSGSNTASVNLSYITNGSALPEANVQILISATGSLPGVSSEAFTIAPPACTSLAFTTSPQTITAGNVSGPITIEAESPFGAYVNTCTITNAIVNLGVSPALGTFSSDAGGTLPITATTLGGTANNPHQATFYYQGTIAGLYSITVSQSGGLTSANQSMTVVAGPPSKLAVTQINPSTPTAGSPGFSATIQSQDAFGNQSNVAANTNVTLSLNTGSGTLGGTVTGQINAGSSSTTISGITYTTAESGVSINAAAASLATGTRAPFTVNPGAPTQLSVTQQPSSTATGGTPFSTQPKIALLDANGNVVTTNNSTQVASRNYEW